MISRPLARPIRFGESLGYLSAVNEHTPLKGSGYILDNLALLADYIEDYGFATASATMELSELAARLHDSDSDYLAEADVPILWDVVRRLSKQILSEARRQETFAVTVTNPDPDTLLRHPERLMQTGVFNAMVKRARLDFAEAARCYAHDLPLAAATLFVRSVEAQVRAAYPRIVPVQHRSAQSSSWKDMLNQMGNQLGSQFDIVRSQLFLVADYRNKIMHGDTRVVIPAVVSLMMTCAEAMNGLHALAQATSPHEGEVAGMEEE